VVVLVLGLRRPVRREHVFEAGADSVAVLVVAGDSEWRRHTGDRHVEVLVGERVATLGIEQARTPGPADARRRRAEAAGILGREARNREGHAVVVVAEPAVLAFDTDHPVAIELIVETALDAAEEVAAIAGETVVAG